MSTYIKDYDKKTNWIYFWIKDDGLLNKYKTIWHKSSADAKLELNDKPVYNKKCLKTEKKFYDDDVTDFYNKEVPKVDISYTCLAVTALDLFLGNMRDVFKMYFLRDQF